VWCIRFWESLWFGRLKVFILHVESIDFNNTWIKCIKTCLESTAVTILVNESPILEFKLRRVLRQGDLITSFLFLIVVERMTDLVREATRKKLLEGIEVGSRGVRKVIQFVDDTSFFFYWELCSRLRVNFIRAMLGLLGWV